MDISPSTAAKIITAQGAFDVIMLEPREQVIDAIKQGLREVWLQMDGVRVDERGRTNGKVFIEVRSEDVRSFMVLDYQPPSQLDMRRQQTPGMFQ